MNNNQSNNMNQPMNYNQPNNMNQQMNYIQPKKKFNIALGIGIVIGIAILIYIILSLASLYIRVQGDEGIPLANFISSISLLLCVFIVIVGTIIVLIVGTLKNKNNI